MKNKNGELYLQRKTLQKSMFSVDPQSPQRINCLIEKILKKFSNGNERGR